MGSHIHIEMDAFDREYGLADLLPRERTADWLGDLGAAWAAAVLRSDGTHYCGAAHPDGEGLAKACRMLADGSAGFGTHPSDRADTVVYPLRHELETIGFLVLQARPPAAVEALSGVGRFIARAIERMMQLAQGARMTAGLHGRVVEDSYARLAEKARLLRLSEEKYRHQAQQLEVEVRRQTEEIQKAQLALFQQEKLAAIGRLSAGVAHEINNPIGFVISNLNSLSDHAGALLRIDQQHEDLAAMAIVAHGAENPELARRVEEIVRLRQTLDVDFLREDIPALIAESLEGAQRVRTIVRQLTDFAHPSIESAESVDIHHCLETTLSMLAGEIPPGVQVRTIYGEIPAVRCHLRALNQVFFHLLRNALQAVGVQGAITLETHATDDRRVEVRVADTGPGIAPEQLPRIFDPFYTTREPGQGTGLGLYLAHNIIKQHGGTIHVESRPGNGCLFRVHMPLG